MLKLSQLDLQFAFLSTSALSENIEDEGSPIKDFAIEHLLQVAALGGRKFVVKNDRINVRAAAMIGEFACLAFADKGSGARRNQFLHSLANHLASCRGCQFNQFLQRIAQLAAFPGFEFHPDEKNSFRPAVPDIDE